MINQLYDIAFRALDQRDPQGPQQPMPGNPALVEGPSPTVDLGTAEVDDSNYDGARYCSYCRARTPAGCKCRPSTE